MIEIERCNDKQLWDDYVLEHDGHPLQLWGWGQVKAGHEWSVERMCAYDDGRLVGVAQVLIRRLPFPFKAFAYIPRGPIIEPLYLDEFLDRLAQMAKRDHTAMVLSIEPNSREIALNAPWRKSQQTILASETILLNLSQSEDQLLAAMAKKTRQYIRKSATDGVVIKRIKAIEDINQCLDMYAETAKRARFNLHNRQYYLDVQQQMGEHSPIFVAYENNQPVAFLWLAVSTGVAYELYGGMNDDGQRLRANYALKWYAIQKMKEWGVSQYDFGGLVAGGVSIFKQGWGDAVSLVGTYDFPLSPLYPIWTKLLPSAKKIIRRLKRR